MITYETRKVKHVEILYGDITYPKTIVFDSDSIDLIMNNRQERTFAVNGDYFAEISYDKIFMKVYKPSDKVVENNNNNYFTISEMYNKRDFCEVQYFKIIFDDDTYEYITCPSGTVMYLPLYGNQDISVMPYLETVYARVTFLSDTIVESI